MARFSERYGHSSPRTSLQVQAIDEALQNRLWNVLKIWVFDPYMRSGTLLNTSNSYCRLVIAIWSTFLKRSLDKLNQMTSYSYAQIADFFYSAEWYQIYDFIEFIIQRLDDEELKVILRAEINSVLVSEAADCRIVGDVVTPIINEAEIQSVERSLESSGAADLHTVHFDAALKLLSDRTAPDYRNSIKESISAVEQVCQRVAGTSSAGVSEALAVIEKKHSLHGAFKKSLSSLYGFTSDGGGIRHPLKDEGVPTQQDALFMLVACSAFVNYLLSMSA
jgi:hypothetical protein